MAVLSNSKLKTARYAYTSKQKVDKFYESAQIFLQYDEKPNIISTWSRET